MPLDVSKLPTSGRVKYEWRSEPSPPGPSPEPLGAEALLRIFRTRQRFCTPELKYENDPDRPDVIRITTMIEWKFAVEHGLRRDVEYFRVMSVDTEQDRRWKPEERVCLRTTADGEVVCAERHKFLVIGTAHPKTYLVDLDEVTPQGFRQEFPVEFITWLSDKSILKIGSGLRKDVEKDFRGFVVDNFIDTLEAIPVFEDKGIFRRDPFELVCNRTGLGTIAISLYDYDYKPPFWGVSGYIDQHKLRCRYTKDSLEPFDKGREGRHLYTWNLHDFQPEILGYLRSDACIPLALGFEVAINSIIQGLRKSGERKQEWEVLHAAWQFGREDDLDSDVLLIHAEDDLLEEFLEEDSGDTRSDFRAEIPPIGLPGWGSMVQLDPLPETFTVGRVRLPSITVKIPNRFRYFTIPKTHCIYTLCPAKDSHSLFDCPTLHNICPSCSMRGHGEEVCRRYTLGRCATFFSDAVDPIVEKCGNSMDTLLYPIPFKLPLTISGPFLEKLEKSASNRGPIGRLNMIIKTLRSCVGQRAEEERFRVGLEALEQLLSAQKERSEAEEKYRISAEASFRSRRDELAVMYEVSVLAGSAEEEAAEEFWTELVKCEKSLLRVGPGVPTGGPVEEAELFLIIKGLTIKTRKTKSTK